MRYAAYMTITDEYFTTVEGATPSEAKSNLLAGKHGAGIPSGPDAGQPDGQWMALKRRQITFRVVGPGDKEV